MVEVELTVGKLDASLALLLTRDHHLIEFPTILLPDDIQPGSIIKLNCTRDTESEKRQQQQFDKLQNDIFNTFGKYEPSDPILHVLNITQTCCVLEWEALELGTSELKSLSLYKNGSKMTSIKNPISKKTIKFSGLPIDTTYKFQLKMETSCGIYWSNLVELKTHKMTDLSGITICLGDIDYSQEKFTREDIESIVQSIGAKPITSFVKVDTTQFICTKDTGLQYQTAIEANIPIVRPEWLKACQLERRIVGVNKFYLNSEAPLWKDRDFWSMKANDGAAKVQAREPEEFVVPVINEPTDQVSENEELANEEVREPIEEPVEAKEAIRKSMAGKDVDVAEGPVEAKEEVPKAIEERDVEATEEPGHVDGSVDEPVEVTEALQEMAKEPTENTEELNGVVQTTGDSAEELTQKQQEETIEEPVAIEKITEETTANDEASNKPIEGSLEATREPGDVELAEESVVGEASEEPLVGEVTEELVVGEASEEPVAGEVSEEPVVGEASEEPVAGEVSEEPVVGEASEEPVVGDVSEEPVVGDVSEEPVVGDVSEEPVVGEAAEEPADLEAAKEPVANEINGVEGIANNESKGKKKKNKKKNKK